MRLTRNGTANFQAVADLIAVTVGRTPYQLDEHGARLVFVSVRRTPCQRDEHRIPPFVLGQEKSFTQGAICATLPADEEHK